MISAPSSSANAGSVPGMPRENVGGCTSLWVFLWGIGEVRVKRRREGGRRRKESTIDRCRAVYSAPVVPYAILMKIGACGLLTGSQY
jgi:hypothetical protein